MRIMQETQSSIPGSDAIRYSAEVSACETLEQIHESQCFFLEPSVISYDAE